jgi:hypothetical protein
MVYNARDYPSQTKQKESHMALNKMVTYKETSARGIVLLSLLSILSVFALSAFAPFPQDPADSIIEKILRIATSFGALAGVSAGVGVIVSFLRAFNIVKSDDQAGRATAALNLLSFAALVLFGVFRPDLSLDFLDATAARIASIGLFILGLVLQMIIPAPVLRLMYQARVPVIGAVGERTELRAHFIGSNEPRNWTTDPEELRNQRGQ